MMAKQAGGPPAMLAADQSLSFALDLALTANQKQEFEGKISLKLAATTSF
tara:strand:- start:434 stop:583 length:150 start_codon:yes stop_codon:yes gene_type:complete